MSQRGLLAHPNTLAIWEKQTSELISQPETEHVKVLRYEDFIHPDFNWDRLKTFCELPNIRPEDLKTESWESMLSLN